MNDQTLKDQLHANFNFSQGMCSFASFAKRFCAKTCGFCIDDSDGKCPEGTVRCDDGVCKHEHMC